MRQLSTMTSAETRSWTTYHGWHIGGYGVFQSLYHSSKIRTILCFLHPAVSHHLIPVSLRKPGSRGSFLPRCHGQTRGPGSEVGTSPNVLLFLANFGEKEWWRKEETGHTIFGGPCVVRVLRISRVFRLLSDFWSKLGQEIGKNVMVAST